MLGPAVSMQYIRSAVTLENVNVIFIWGDSMK